MREAVVESIREIEERSAPERAAGPPRRSDAVREAAREAGRSDAQLRFRRQEIEERLPTIPQADLQTPDTFRIPPRQEDAETGSQFMRRIARLGPAAREQAVLDEIQRGNVPDSLRQGRTVELEQGGHRAQVQVMPDYLAIGSNDDFVRMPMTPRTANALAQQFGATLPSKNVVDAVWNQADVRLDPHALTQRREQASTFAQHDGIIRSQLAETEYAPGALVAGHKKDVVDSDRLARRPDRVAIYGWHQSNGKPIQGLSTAHHAGYVDYSHGVRLMSDRMVVDGRSMSVAEVRADPQLRRLLEP